MNTLSLRRRLVDLCRQDRGKEEEKRNQGAWIKKFWPATSYPGGYVEQQPYCAAGLVYWTREWLCDPEVESWRCKSASCFKAADSWEAWAKKKGLWLPGPFVDLNVGDLVIYTHSHIEIVTETHANGNTVLGFNTGNGVERDGRWCYEKPMTVTRIRGAIRMLPREL
jgi:hypothetical protein